MKPASGIQRLVRLAVVLMMALPAPAWLSVFLLRKERFSRLQKVYNHINAIKGKYPIFGIIDS